jgi:hypothetical protein
MSRNNEDTGQERLEREMEMRVSGRVMDVLVQACFPERVQQRAVHETKAATISSRPRPSAKNGSA